MRVKKRKFTLYKGIFADCKKIRYEWGKITIDNINIAINWLISIDTLIFDEYLFTKKHSSKNYEVLWKHVWQSVLLGKFCEIVGSCS